MIQDTPTPARKPYLSVRRLRVAVMLIIAAWFGGALLHAADAAEQSALSFSSTATYPPLNYLENGYPKGLVVDIVRALEHRMVKPIDIRLIASWTDVQAMVQDGKVDLLGPMAITEERKALYDFSTPIIDLSVHLFVRSGRLGIRTLADTRGLRVGVAAGGLAHQVAKTAPGVVLVPLSDDQTKNFRLLADGELDAIIADSWNGGYILAEFKIAGVQMAGDPLLTIPAHLAVKKGNVALLAQVNSALRAIEADGELARIRARWQPKEIVVATREAVQQEKYIAVIGSLLLVLIAGALWIIFMRREIKHRRNAEDLAVKSEQRFRAFFDNAMVGMAVTSPEKGWVMANPALCELFGLTFEVLTTRTWAQLTHPDDLAADVAQFKRVIAGEINGYDMEKRFIRDDGQIVHAYIAARAIRRENRSVDFFSAIVMDISARKQAEQALRESQARYERAVDGANDGLWEWFPATGEDYLSPRWKQLLGYQDHELANRDTTFFEHIHPDDREHATDAIRAHFEANVPYGIELRLLHKNGTYRWFYSRGKAARDDQGKVASMAGSITDITERKQLEIELHDGLARSRELNVKLEQAHNQLLQSEKMASIGQLAAGVAHELNNPIGFIQSNIGTLEGYVADLLDVIDHAEECSTSMESASAEQFRRLCEEKDINYIKSDIRQLMAESKDGADRVRRIVQNLKEFSHVHEKEWQWADLHKGIESTLTVVWNEIKYKAEVKKEYGSLPEVYCLASQLNQVIMNLLVNAAQAIETQGTITIRTGTLSVTDDALPSVWIEVADTGKGIAPENLKRVFEPFFTTKPVGKGTGLGLSLAWGIVQKHHGTLEVQSEVGVGTTFRMTLPVKCGEIQAARAENGGA